MKNLLLCLALLGFTTLVHAGISDTPVTMEISAISKSNREKIPGITTSGEVLNGFATLPLASPYDSLLATIQIDEQAAPASVRVTISTLSTILPAGPASAAGPLQIFVGTFLYAPGKKFTVYETEAYTVQLKITPVEKTK